jgi:essential nuclear protein 1
MPYSGVNSFFIRVLLDKRYALPYRVVDALVDHFFSFVKEERQLPVVWHQALLCFVQRYKAEIRKEDKDLLRQLCQTQHHYLITPEVLRELDASKSRGEKSSEIAAVGSAVGTHVKENPRDLAPMILME